MSTLHAAAILYGLGNMRRRNRIRAGQIGNSPRQLQAAMITARREPEARNRLLEQCGTGLVDRAMAIDFARAELRVRFRLSINLTFVGGGDARAHLRARFAPRIASEFMRLHRGHLDLHINAIEQRP